MPVVVAVINRAPDILSGVIISPIIRTPMVSPISVNIIPGIMSGGPMIGFLVQMARSMPVRIFVAVPRTPVMGEGYAGAQKQQRGCDQKNFLHMGFHRFSPFVKRF